MKVRPGRNPGFYFDNPMSFIQTLNMIDISEIEEIQKFYNMIVRQSKQIGKKLSGNIDTSKTQDIEKWLIENNITGKLSKEQKVEFKLKFF